MAKYQKSNSEHSKKPRPATTPEGRESQMVSLAMELAEKRLRAGTASAQEVTHFLKLGSLNNRVEREILEKQKELITAKTEAIKREKSTDEMYADVIAALRSYSGSNMSDEDPPRRRSRYNDAD